MEKREVKFRQKREPGRIMSDSFDFLKQEAKPISRLILIYVLPFIILYAVAQIYFQQNVLSKFDLTNPESLLADIGPFYQNLLFFMLFGLFIQSLLAGTYYSYLEAYIEKGKGNLELSDITPHLFANSLKALGTGIVFTVIIFAGLIFCIIPGIYLANTLSLVLFIVISEKKGVSNALAKSWKLVNTQWWNTLVINLLGLLIVYAVGLIFSIPSMVVGFSWGFTSGIAEMPIEYPQWYWVLNGIASVVTTTLLIIPFTFQAFQYFNLEESENPILPANNIN